MKIFVSDYDRTLHTNVKNLNINIDYIKKLGSEDKFIISTGRSFISIQREIEKYGIPYDYLMCLDGLIAYDNNDDILYQMPINSRIIERLYNYILTNCSVNEIKLYNEKGETTELNNILEIGVKFKKTDTNQLILIKNIFNVSIWKHKDKYYFKNVSNKSEGLKRLFSILNIEPSNNEIYTFGDYSNDYEMLADFNGYKMICSHPSLWFKGIKTTTQVHKILKKRI